MKRVYCLYSLLLLVRMEIDGENTCVYMCPMKKIGKGVDLEMSCLTIAPIYLKYLYDWRLVKGL
jgi:hypothetical protein